MYIAETGWAPLLEVSECFAIEIAHWFWCSSPIGKMCIAIRKQKNCWNSNNCDFSYFFLLFHTLIKSDNKKTSLSFVLFRWYSTFSTWHSNSTDCTIIFLSLLLSLTNYCHYCELLNINDISIHWLGLLWPVNWISTWN